MTIQPVQVANPKNNRRGEGHKRLYTSRKNGLFMPEFNVSFPNNVKLSHKKYLNSFNKQINRFDTDNFFRFFFL